MNRPLLLFDVCAIVVFLFAACLVARPGKEAQGHRGRLIPWAVLAAIGLALCGYYFMTQYPSVEWRTPILIDYYALPLIWAFSVGGFSFACAMAVATRARSGQSWRMLTAACCALLLAGEGYATIVEWGRPPRLRAPRIDENGVVRQSSGCTCAAACGANIARLFGTDATEAQMVELMGTTEQGTSTAQIIYGLERAGVSTRKASFNNDSIRRVQVPAILFLGGAGHRDMHAVVYTGLDQAGARILDPLRGRCIMTEDQLRLLWSGRALETRKSAEP